MDLEQKQFLAENGTNITSGIVALVAGIFFPAIEVLAFAGFMIFSDTVTGIWAALSRGEKLQSNRMKRVLAKLIIYPMAIVIASFSERLIPGIPFINGSAVLLITIEGKSILENATDILGFDFMGVIKAYVTDGKSGVIKFLKENKK